MAIAERVGVAALLAIAVCVSVGDPAAASEQSNTSTRGPQSSAEFKAFMDDFMGSEMSRLDIPGAAVVVVRDGRVFSSAGYGFADVEKKIPVDPSATLFGIGSVSKPLTAVAVLQQVERGNLDLDGDILSYLDFDVPERDGTAVTVESLLTHTSGFEERRIGFSARDAEAIEPLADFLRGNVPSRFAATGEVHSYSNHNYSFLGYLVERSSGQDFVTYMDDNVFGRLNMQSSAFYHRLPPGLAEQLAVGYVGDSGSRRPGDQVYERDFPAGDVVATPADMGRFMIALLEGGQLEGAEVMSGETSAVYLEPSYRPDPEMPGRTTGGLEEMWINGERAVGHGGDSLGGFAAQMVLLPEYRTGFFVVYNVVSDEFRTNFVDAIFDDFFPDQSPSPTFVELDRAELGRFAGNYRWTRFPRSTADRVLAMTPPYNTFVDASDDGTLTVRWLGVTESWEYRPVSSTVFARVSGEAAVVDGLVVDPGDRISFTVDDGGDVRYLNTSLHTVALEKVSFLSLGIVQISTFGTIVVVFVLSMLVWPVGAFIRKRRNRPAPTAWARRALWIEIGVAATLVLATFAFFLAVGDSGIAFGPTPSLYLATGLITIGSIASLALIPAAVASWIYRWFTIGGRIFYSLLALIAPYFIWWAANWNLLGFQF